METLSVYPFTAVIGQDHLIKALLMSVVNPKVGGVLISGERGTAKSTIVRALADLLMQQKIIDLPLNATEEMVIGTLNLEKATKEGRKEFEAGLLEKVDGHFLYIDEVNLLSDTITKIILDAASSGINRVEREGISFAHSAKFSLIGTMNPEEGQLSPQFLDRFGLYVEVKAEAELQARVEIIKRRLQYEADPKSFCLVYEQEKEALCKKLERAKQRIERIDVPEAMIDLCANIALEANCSGHRADLFLLEAAKASAALNEQNTVSANDVKEAAQYVIVHRIREKPESQQDNQQEGAGTQENRQENMTNDTNKEDQRGDGDQSDWLDHMHSSEQLEDDYEHQRAVNQESIAEIGEQFKVNQVITTEKDRQLRKGSGKRSKTRSGSKKGRFVKSGFPNGKLTDLAFVATIRAAAPFQKLRKSNGNAITIVDSDLREKVREKRIGNTLLFVVDASGSMGAQQRMKAVKGATLSILNDAYQKRDAVGMIAFRNETAELILAITRSIDLAQKKLSELPTGGKTPLAQGLYLGYQELMRALKTDPETLPILIVVTDGKANCSMNGEDPVKEALDIAQYIATTGVKSLVIDVENNFINLGIAKEIAKALNADYYKLDQLRSDEIVAAVKAVL